MSALAELKLDADGAELFKAALAQAEVDAFLAALGNRDKGRPGARLTNLDGLRDWLDINGMVGQIAANWLGPAAAPVRAILLDKNVGSNWALAWHQDRTIAVAERADVPGFANWNRKDGVDHVEPPFALIERMITVRIHLDQVGISNAPLLISPGSDRLARSPKPISRLWSSAMGRPNAWLKRATFGPTARLSCTLRSVRLRLSAVGSCRSITVAKNCRNRCAGSSSLSAS